MIVVLLLVTLGIFVVFQVLIARRERQRSEKEFPPLSDAEFVARCTPGVDPDVALRVRRIVADSLGVSYEMLHPSTRFWEDIGAD
jgi:hypothetical protein